MLRREDPDESGRKGDEATGFVDRVHQEEARQREFDRARRARVVKALVIAGLAILLIIFVTTNTRSTRVSFVLFSATFPLIWVIVGCTLVGGVIGFLIGKPGKQLRLPGKKRGGDPAA